MLQLCTEYLLEHLSGLHTKNVLAVEFNLGRNIRKVPSHAAPHDLSRIKPVTLGISSYD